MTAAESVRDLYGAYQERDWARAAALLHPRAVVAMPASAERLEGRDAIVSFQSSYPEPWGTLSVRSVLADGEGAAAEVGVIDPGGGRFVFATFWRTRDGLLGEGTEYWVTVGGEPPPASRASSAATRAARAAWERGES